MMYEQWLTEPRECVAFVDGAGDYPLRIFRDSEGVWWMAGYVPSDDGSELIDVYDPLGDRRIWPIRPPSDAGDTIVPQGIEDAAIDVREDVPFASDDAKRYEAELNRLAAFVQTRHPSGAVKHIGLMECVPAAMELISEASEWIGRHVRPDDSEPITAEWLNSSGGVWSTHYSGVMRFPWDDDLYLLPDDNGWIPAFQSGYSSSIRLAKVRTRGDLRRLWRGLIGKELGQ